MINPVTHNRNTKKYSNSVYTKKKKTHTHTHMRKQRIKAA